MSTSIEPYISTGINFDHGWIEQVILDLADTFQIRILWNRDTDYLTGGMAVVGGLIGGYAGGRMGAALGAGIGGATGLGVSVFVNLRDIWEAIKGKLEELTYIVFNYLRRLDAIDYVHAVNILIACSVSRKDLVLTILDFIAEKLGRQVLSSIHNIIAE